MKEICNTLAEQFAFNSSSDNYSHMFKRYRLKLEKKTIDFDTNDQYSYNDVFTLHELKHAIKVSRDTSTGIDTVHYQLLKHLPEDRLLLLLYIFILVDAGFSRLHGRLLLLYMFLSRVRCFQILVVTGLLPLIAVYVKQWSGWSTVD